MTEKTEISRLDVNRAEPQPSTLQALENYWHNLRGARRLPVRTDVSPRDIDAALPYAFIIERVAPTVARFRVAGQRLGEMLGGDGRGMPITCLFTANGRDTLAPYLSEVFDGPALIELPLVASRGFARSKITGRLLIMPLESQLGVVDRALGAVLVDGTPTGKLCTFDIPKDAPHRCEVVPMPTPLHVASVNSGVPVTNKEGPALARPALRLVVNND